MRSSKVSKENAGALPRCRALPTVGLVGVFVLVDGGFRRRWIVGKGIAAPGPRRRFEPTWCEASRRRGYRGAPEGARTMIGGRAVRAVSPQVRATIEFPAPTASGATKSSPGEEHVPFGRSNCKSSASSRSTTATPRSCVNRSSPAVRRGDAEQSRLPERRHNAPVLEPSWAGVQTDMHLAGAAAIATAGICQS